MSVEAVRQCDAQIYESFSARYAKQNESLERLTQQAKAFREELNFLNKKYDAEASVLVQKNAEQEINTFLEKQQKELEEHNQKIAGYEQECAAAIKFEAELSAEISRRYVGYTALTNCFGIIESLSPKIHDQLQKIYRVAREHLGNLRDHLEKVSEHRQSLQTEIEGSMVNFKGIKHHALESYRQRMENVRQRIDPTVLTTYIKDRSMRYLKDLGTKVGFGGHDDKKV